MIHIRWECVRNKIIMTKFAMRYFSLHFMGCTGLVMAILAIYFFTSCENQIIHMTHSINCFTCNLLNSNILPIEIKWIIKTSSKKKKQRTQTPITNHFCLLWKHMHTHTDWHNKMKLNDMQSIHTESDSDVYKMKMANWNAISLSCSTHQFAYFKNNVAELKPLDQANK